MRTLCRSNLFRVAVLLWFVGWLLVVMPGHTRGVVRLPGSAMQAASSCCEPTPSCCSDPVTDHGDHLNNPCDRAGDGDGDQPTLPPEDPAKHCAICFLKAHLTDAPPTTWYTPYLGELDEIAYAPYTSICNGRSTPLQSRGRAPPA